MANEPLYPNLYEAAGVPADLIAESVAAEREACALAIERAYLACTEPGVFNRHVWAQIVEQAKQTLRECQAPSTDCDVCRMPMAVHGPTMEHPPAFQSGRDYEREECASAVQTINIPLRGEDEFFSAGYAKGVEDALIAIRARGAK